MAPNLLRAVTRVTRRLVAARAQDPAGLRRSAAIAFDASRPAAPAGTAQAPAR